LYQAARFKNPVEREKFIKWLYVVEERMPKAI
jgi:hypothetical protein